MRKELWEIFLEFLALIGRLVEARNELRTKHPEIEFLQHK